MSDVIDVLESLGRDAQWHDAAPEELKERLAQAQLDPAVRAAIVGGDGQALRGLLGRGPMFGILMPGEEEEDEQEEVPEQDRPSPDDGDGPRAAPADATASAA